MELEYESGMELAVKVIFGEDFGLPVRLLSAKVETLYITPPFWTHQRTKKLSEERRQFTEQERNAIFRRIFEIVEKTNPDELDLVYGDYQVRAWWD